MTASRFDWTEVLHQTLKGLTLAQIAARPGMPKIPTITARISRDPAFAELMALVREQAPRRILTTRCFGERDEPMWARFFEKLKPGKTIASICREPGTPSRQAVCVRLKEDQEFSERVRAVIPAGRGGSRTGLFTPLGDEVWSAVLKRLAQGASTKEVCREAGMPCYRTFLVKRASDPDFAWLVSEVYDRTKASAQFKNRKADARTSLQAYELAAKLVPKSLPPDIRDDVISNMVMAVAEGRVTLASLKNNPRPYFREHYRMFDQHKVVSLDEPMFDGEGRTRGDGISSDTFHF